MAIDLAEFSSGDTDYIAKLNANVAALENAINALQAQAGSIPASFTTGTLMSVMFNNADALIGMASYKPTPSATTLIVAPGGAYLVERLSCVQSLAPQNLDFVGQPSGTYYVVIDGAGAPTRSETQDPGTVYSAFWNGTSFGTITRLVPVFFDTIEANASRISTALATAYQSLDLRLEAGEVLAKDAKIIAQAALDKITISTQEPDPIYRKIGTTVGITTIGAVGAIQVEFNGTIVGWSVIADVATAILNVDVYKKASSVPPAAPQVPGGGDKISASAPIALATAISAASGTAGVSTWSPKRVTQWDVIQFRVTLASGFNRATLYVLILQDPPYAVVTMPAAISSTQIFIPTVVGGA